MVESLFEIPALEYVMSLLLLSSANAAAAVAASTSLQEVSKHRTPADAWMVYKNKVYDVSGWHEVSLDLKEIAWS